MFKQVSAKRAYSIVITSLLSLCAISSQAVQFPDGRSSFEKSPLLVDMMTTQSGVSIWGAKYYVTIDLPSDIGEPLGKVTIQQQRGFQDINYRINQTFAYSGTRRNRGEEIAIKSATIDETQNLITVIFAMPVSPGRKVTIGLVPRINPDYDGIYLFRITAFPVGEKPMGLSLGVGELTFYRNSWD